MDGGWGLERGVDRRPSSPFDFASSGRLINGYLILVATPAVYQVYTNRHRNVSK